MLYKAIDVWKRNEEAQLVRYRCFQVLSTGKYCVQSADFYEVPTAVAKATDLERQFLELLRDASPDTRAGGFDSLEEAIANHDKYFQRR